MYLGVLDASLATHVLPEGVTWLWQRYLPTAFQLLEMVEMNSMVIDWLDIYVRFSVKRIGRGTRSEKTRVIGMETFDFGSDMNNRSDFEDVTGYQRVGYGLTQSSVRLPFL